MVVVGEKVDVMVAGGWARDKLVVKVHAGPLYDVDIEPLMTGKNVVVLTEKEPCEVRAHGPTGSVVPFWSAAEIDALTVRWPLP